MRPRRDGGAGGDVHHELRRKIQLLCDEADEVPVLVVQVDDEGDDVHQAAAPALLALDADEPA